MISSAFAAIPVDMIVDHQTSNIKHSLPNIPSRGMLSSNSSPRIHDRSLDAHKAIQGTSCVTATSAAAEPLNSSRTNGIMHHNGTDSSLYSIPECLTNAPLGDQPYDLICVGFGPASLAIAIALRDRGINRRVLFLERQPHFAWHAGMLLPGSRMQISFIKDLATFRDPTSHFTFLNYLHKKNRLVTFTNLGTFLPFREEYNDYLSWCASHFDDQVRYGETVCVIDPIKSISTATVTGFKVISTDLNGSTTSRTARHVVIAVGGRSNIPKPFPRDHYRCLHSSGYRTMVTTILSDPDAPYRIAVIGGGQSAAEIFSDLHSRYPNCKTRLIIKGQSLRPSDDSPFVNEIFNPEKVDEVFSLPSAVRTASIHSDKATNYGVVRLELLEKIYEYFYVQRLREPDSRKWQHQILSLREVVDTKAFRDHISLRLRHLHTGKEEEEAFDVAIVATGYVRDVHERLLGNAKDLLPTDEKTGMTCWTVGRDYRLQFDRRKVSPDVGIWLQGCCETTHGLSDTLLSIISVRSGELVDSIFGEQKGSEQNTA